MSVAPAVRAEPHSLQVKLRPVLVAIAVVGPVALGLRFVAGLTQAEIAARVGVSQMQISRLLTSSLSRLRARMSVADGGDDVVRV